MKLIARIRCWFTAHDDRKALDPVKRTIKLTCAECGRQSTGWTLDGDEPRVRQHGDQQRHVIFNPRLAQKPKSPTWWLKSVHLGKGA